MATFITSKAVGETISIYIKTSTGFFKYDHDGSNSAVIAHSVGKSTRRSLPVININGEFTLISCNSDGTVNGNITQLDLVNNQLTSLDVTSLSSVNKLSLAGQGFSNPITPSANDQIGTLENQIQDANQQKQQVQQVIQNFIGGNS